MSDPAVVVSFKDMDTSDKVRDMVETRCLAFAEEFPETTKYEIILSPDGSGHTAHGHVTGRGTDVASHASGHEVGEAANKLLDKLERALRRTHDKKIFKNRRDAQKADLKRHQ